MLKLLSFVLALAQRGSWWVPFVISEEVFVTPQITLQVTGIVDPDGMRYMVIAAHREGDLLTLKIKSINEGVRPGLPNSFFFTLTACHRDMDAKVSSRLGTHLQPGSQADGEMYFALPPDCDTRTFVLHWHLGDGDWRDLPVMTLD